MKKSCVPIFAILFIILMLPAAACAEDIWLKNGQEEIAAKDNIKTVDNFGVQLWVVDPVDFPKDPNIKVRQRVKRGEPISTLLFFINPGVNEKSKCDVVYDVVVKGPDGKSTVDLKGLEVWKDKAPPPHNMIQAAYNNLDLNFEKKDLPGLYTIDALVKNRVKKIDIPLHQEIFVE